MPAYKQVLLLAPENLQNTKALLHTGGSYLFFYEFLILFEVFRVLC